MFWICIVGLLLLGLCMFLKYMWNVVFFWIGCSGMICIRWLLLSVRLNLFGVIVIIVVLLMVLLIFCLFLVVGCRMCFIVVCMYCGCGDCECMCMVVVLLVLVCMCIGWMLRLVSVGVVGSRVSRSMLVR